MTNKDKMTNFRWVICAMLFFATTVNYLDRQVLSLTWDEFIKPEFHWDESHYGTVTSIFSIIYAISMVFAGRFVDWLGTKKGYLWAIGIWSLGACMHAFCGIVTEAVAGMDSAAELVRATGDAVVLISTVSMYCFLVARSVLAIGESGNFPAAIKTTAEYFPMQNVVSEIGYRSVSMRCSPFGVALERAAQQISNKNAESQLCSLAVFAFSGSQK